VESFESLDTIAEVAVTLAGFAGMIAALAGASHQGLPRRQRIAFWLVLATSLATLILSFLPRVLFNFGLSEPTSWRICCGVLALVNFVTLGLLIRVRCSRKEFPRSSPLCMSSFRRRLASSHFWHSLRLWASLHSTRMHFSMLASSYHLPSHVSSSSSSSSCEHLTPSHLPPSQRS
jgi:hypothetical protein